MPTAAHPTGHPLSPRRRAGLAVVVGTLLAFLAVLTPATAAPAPAAAPVAG